jgi:hypothetical protein
MDGAMNDLRQKAAGGGGLADKWNVAHGGNDQVVPTHANRPEAKQRFAGDDAGYMFDDHGKPTKAGIAAGMAAMEEHREWVVRDAVRKANDSEDDEQSDSDDDLLDDPELDKIRDKRLGEIRGNALERAEQVAKGHGAFTEISQDEFLPCVTASKFALVHFYHKDFERCKVIDMHLKDLSFRHMECRFLKIDAEKCPFFVEKLMVRVLPTIVCFIDGIAQNEDRIVGYQGLIDEKSSEEGKEDEFKTTTLAQRLTEIGVIDYTAPPTEEELEKYGLGEKCSIYSGSRAIGDADDFLDD